MLGAIPLAPSFPLFPFSFKTRYLTGPDMPIRVDCGPQGSSCLHFLRPGFTCMYHQAWHFLAWDLGIKQWVLYPLSLLSSSVHGFYFIFILFGVALGEEQEGRENRLPALLVHFLPSQCRQQKGSWG